MFTFAAITLLHYSTVLEFGLQSSWQINEGMALALYNRLHIILHIRMKMTLLKY